MSEQTTTAPELSPAQRRVFAAIAVRQQTIATGPSLRDLTGILGVSSTFGVHRHVQTLREAGLIEPDAGRGLILTPLAQSLIANK